ncbi:MAG: hypothetical protein KDB27_03340 [Planctomycetales bacterium]|nr:hypothetical protein [Planctomycetales bacterium]
MIRTAGIVLAVVVASPVFGELIELEIMPGGFPTASSVSASINAGVLGKDEENSSVSGKAILSVDSLSDPISEAEIVELSLTLDDGFDFRLGLGALRASAAPGSVVATMVEPGLAEPVVNGRFNQLNNRFELSGVIDVSIDPDPIDLALLEAQPLDIEGIELNFVDDRLVAELGIELVLEYEVENVPIFGTIPVSIELSGNIMGRSQTIKPRIAGDFDGDGVFGLADINELTEAVQTSSNDLKFDLDLSGTVDLMDRTHWVEVIANTFFGDANMDGEFNSSDFVRVFQAGQYEDGITGNSVWETGDWNGDGDFDSSDFVIAFQSNGFESGPRATKIIPEPVSSSLLPIAMIMFLRKKLRLC